jgi:hypothetical protein
MHTRAPDRGRDLSMERVLQTGTGTVRTERVMVQAKHWLKRSVAPADVASTIATVTLSLTTKCPTESHVDHSSDLSRVSDLWHA